MAINIQKTEYDIPDPGIYTAKIVEIEETVGKFGDQIRFIWDENDEQFQNLWYFTSTTFSSKSKLGKLVAALLGTPFSNLPSGLDIEDALIGKEAKLVIEHQENTSGTTYAKITSVLPMKNADNKIGMGTIGEITSLMKTHNLQNGVLEILYKKDKIADLTKTEATDLISKINNDELSYATPDGNGENEKIPF